MNRPRWSQTWYCLILYLFICYNDTYEFLVSSKKKWSYIFGKIISNYISVGILLKPLLRTFTKFIDFVSSFFFWEIRGVILIQLFYILFIEKCEKSDPFFQLFSWNKPGRNVVRIYYDRALEAL